MHSMKIEESEKVFSNILKKYPYHIECIDYYSSVLYNLNLK